MSFTGKNFDVVTGLSAIVVAALLARRPHLARGPLPRVWNAAGSLLLATVVGLSIASTPQFHAFGTEPAALNTFIATPPYTWLPTVMVATALVGHLVLGRRLAEERAAAGPVTPGAGAP